MSADTFERLTLPLLRPFAIACIASRYESEQEDRVSAVGCFGSSTRVASQMKRMGISRMRVSSRDDSVKNAGLPGSDHSPSDHDQQNSVS